MEREVLHDVNFDELIRGRFMNTDQYVEHEVQIRVMREVSSEKFTTMGKSIDHINNKLNWIIGIVVGSVFIPVALHFLKLI